MALVYVYSSTSPFFGQLEAITWYLLPIVFSPSHSRKFLLMTLSKNNFHHRVASIFWHNRPGNNCKNWCNQQQFSPGSPDIISTQETASNSKMFEPLSQPLMTLFKAGLCERQCGQNSWIAAIKDDEPSWTEWRREAGGVTAVQPLVLSEMETTGHYISSRCHQQILWSHAVPPRRAPPPATWSGQRLRTAGSSSERRPAGTPLMFYNDQRAAEQMVWFSKSAASLPFSLTGTMQSADIL